MKKMRCQFDISKDWVKPSLVFAYGISEKESLADILTDVYNESLKKEFGDDLEGLGPDVNDKINAINEVKELMQTLCNIYDDAKYVQTKNAKLLHPMQLKYLKILDGYQNTIDTFFDSILNRYNDSFLPIPIEEEVNDAFTREELENINLDIEPSLPIEEVLDQKDNNILESSVWGPSTRTIAIDNDINLDVKITSDSDVGFKLFKGKITAKEDFVKRFTTELVSRAIISTDPDNPKVFTNNIDIDTSVKLYKDKLFFSVFGEPLYVNDGDSKPMRPDYKQKINEKIEEYNSMNNGEGLLAKDIDAMMLSKDRKEYDAFINFSILKNFDSLIKIYGNKMVNIKENADYMPDVLNDGSIKYYFKKDSRAAEAFSNSEFVDAMSKVSGIAKMFIESTPEIDDNGFEVKNKYLRIDRVFNTTTTLGRIISRVNHFESLKETFEDIIKKDQGIKGYSKSLDNIYMSKDEISMIKSLYVKFFKTNESLIDGKLGKFGTNVLRNYNQLSFYEVLNAEYRNGNMPMNLVDIIGSTFAKTIALKYDEVSFSPEEKEYRIKNLTDNISLRQAYLLNNSISASFFTVNNKTSEKLFSRYNIEADIDGYLVKIQLPSGVVLTHDVRSGKTKNTEGEDFDFSSIATPNIISLEHWKDPGIFSDYMFILSAFQNFTSQQLKGLDSSIINTFKSNIDTATNEGKHISYLMSILANSAYIRKFIVEKIPNGIVDGEAQIPTALSSIPDINPDDIYNKRSRLFNVSFNRFATSATGVLSNAMAIVTGDKSKSVIKNSEGNSLPVYGPVNLINDVKSLIDLIQINRNKFQKKIPLEENIFIQSPDLLKGLSVRTNYENAGKTKSSAKLSEGETIVVDILYSYGNKKVSDGNPAFQPTVFSDKTKHSGVEVNGEAELTFMDENTGEQITKKYSDMTSDEFKSLHYQSQHNYYKNLEDSIVKTYDEVFRGHDAVISYLQKTKVLQHAEIVDYDGESLSIRKFAKKFDGDNIKKEIDILNKIFKVQQSYRKKNKFKDINEAALFVRSVTDKELLNLAKENTKRPIVVELLYTKGDGSAIISEPLISAINTYRSEYSKDSDLYNNMMLKAKNTFIEKLERGFSVDYLDDNGNENGLINDIYSKFKIDKNKWINSYTKRLVPFIKSGDSVELNPFIEQYFWEHNLIAENFQNLTVGTIFGHKGNNEAKKTVAMLKRMVAHQATFHPYYNGSLNGVNHITKTVYVKDPQSYLQNIMGMKKDDQEITDGGSAISMVESILKNNSLLDQAVAIHKKDIGMTIDPYYNAAGLMKHASHAISNEDIRRTKGSSYDLKILTSKMYKGEPITVADGKIYQWNIDGIPINIDITRDFNNRFIGDIESLNPMFKNGYYYINQVDNGVNKIGDIIKVSRISPVSTIENEGITIAVQPNSYIISQENISRGIDATISNVPIHNLNDLWNVFGAEHSISIDPNGKFSADGIKFSYSDASHYILAEFTNRIGFWRTEEGFNKLLQQTLNKHSKSGVTVTSINELRKLTDMLTTVDDKRIFNKDVDIPTQASVFQPLKHNHIGMINFASGQKVGAKNINNPSVLTNDDDFWVSETNNLHTGVQLDYEHETDDSHVTEMTQIISAMIFNGDTRDVALNTYSAIGEYVKNQIKDFVESTNNATAEGQRKSWIQLADVVIKKQGSDKSSLQGMILSAVESSLSREKELIGNIEKARNAIAKGTDSAIVAQATTDLANYMKASFNMPMSDSSLFSTAFSTLANHFTAAAIRRKFEGGGLIISGLSGFIELQDFPIIDLTSDNLVTNEYKSYTQESYNSWIDHIKTSKYYENKIKEGVSHDEIINDILREPTIAANALIGDTVIYTKDGVEKRVYLEKYSDYLDFKRETTPSLEIKIDRTAKRQMRPLNWTWNSANIKFNLFDQPQVKRAYLFDDYLSLLDDVINLRPSKLESDEKIKEKKIKSESGLSKFELDLNSEKYNSALNKYIEFCDSYGSLLVGLGFDNALLAKTPKAIASLSKLNNIKYIRQILKMEIRNECKDIDEGNMSINDDLAYMILKEKTKFKELYPDLEGLVDDVKGLKSTDEIINYCLNHGIKFPISNLVAKPMEVGLPNMSASKYGLPKDIDISEVTQATFEQQELSRIKSKIKYYDMYLRDINGKHLYVFVKDSKNHKNLLANDSFKESKNSTIIKDGKNYLIDPNTGAILYEIGDSKFGHISQNGEIHDAIVVNSVDELKSLVYNTTEDQHKYANLIVNYRVKDRKLLNFAIEYKLSENISDTDRVMLDTAKSVLENKALPENKATENIVSILDSLNKGQLSNLKTQAKKNAKYRFSSFNESLKYTIARIKKT